MKGKTKFWIALLISSPLLSLPAVIFNAVKGGKDTFEQIWKTKAFQQEGRFGVEFLRWSLFVTLLLATIAFINLLLGFCVYSVRHRRTKLAYLLAVRPFILFAAILGAIQACASLLLYQSTLNSVNGFQINLKGFLITRYERLVLIVSLFAGSLFLVKYIMARIDQARFQKSMTKRVQKSDQKCVALAKLYKSAYNIYTRKRRKSKSSSIDEKVDLDAESAKSFLEGKDPEIIAKTIVSSYLPKTDSTLKIAHLGISFPPAEATTVYGMLASNLEEPQVVEEPQSEEGLTLGDLCESIKRIFTEWHNLKKNQTSSAKLSRRLESALLVFTFLIATLISLMLIHSDGYLFALQIIAIITGFGYMTEDTIKRIFNCFMFAFVQHPFDIGDVIVFDGQRWTVTKVRMFSMEAISEQGLLTDIPVSNIVSKNISNLSRTAK